MVTDEPTDMRSLDDLEASLDEMKHRRARLLHDISVRGQRADNVPEGLHAAILLKEYSADDNARRVFARLSALFTDDASVAHEHAQFHRHAGDHDAAIAIVESAIRRGVVNDGIVADLLLAAFLDPPHGEAGRRAASLLRPALDLARSPYLAAVARHYRRRMRSHGLVLARATERVITPWGAYRMAARALRARRPFCMVRLGDGEGAFLDEPGAPADEQAMLRVHRGHWCERWLGHPALQDHEAVRGASGALRSQLANADIIGAPDGSWIDHERRGRNLRALTGCLRAAEGAQAAGQAAPAIASTTLPIDMLARRMIGALLKQAGTIDVVTCHEELAPALERGLGVRVRHVNLIPPPHCDDRNRVARPGARPPQLDAIAAARAAISGIGAGDLVVIGGGFLGKELAFHAKACGGIGLDVGSILDLMLDRRTRPGFAGLEHLRLPVMRQPDHGLARVVRRGA